jgi:hypothetical protein
MTPSPPATQLRRGQVPRPDAPDTPVPLFASWEQAVAHLGDHVLTVPECRGWALVLGDPDCLPPGVDAAARQALAERALATAGLAVQELFDLYAGAVRSASRDAALLGWHASEGAVTAGLGTAGLLLLIDGGVARTAFLPGQGDPEVVRQAAQRGPAALPRERGMRPARGPGRHPREEWRYLRRQQSWSADEQLYHLVFRPAVQFVRSRYHHYRDASGRLLRCDYALLKPVLPAMSELTLDGWRGRRGLCGHGGSP